jgi:hypothetical protein
VSIRESDDRRYGLRVYQNMGTSVYGLPPVGLILTYIVDQFLGDTRVATSPLRVAVAAVLMSR